MIIKKVIKSIHICKNASLKRVKTRVRPPFPPPCCKQVPGATYPTRPQKKGHILVLTFWIGEEFDEKQIENVNFKQISLCIKIFFI